MEIVRREKKKNNEFIRRKIKQYRKDTFVQGKVKDG